MGLITWLGRLVGLVGVGLVGLGALLMLEQTAYTVPVSLMTAGLVVIIADMAVLSFVRRQPGLGVIY